MVFMSKQTAIRLPEELLPRIDAFSDRVNRYLGVKVNRSEAIRLLLEAAINISEKKEARTAILEASQTQLIEDRRDQEEVEMRKQREMGKQPKWTVRKPRS